MAATALPEPGTEYGPCLDEGCGHRDCEANRQAAATACTECGQPIGYGRMHYRDNAPDECDWSKLVHQSCYVRRLHRERAAV